MKRAASSSQQNLFESFPVASPPVRPAAPATTVSGFQPTEEQERARDLFLTRQNLKLIGRAGAAKTTTLELLGKASPRQGIYLAFNSAIKEEAARRMPVRVRCYTTHSLALRFTEGKYRDSRGKCFDSPNANAVANALGLRELNTSTTKLTARQVAACIQATIRTYCNSDDEKLGTKHVRLTGALARLRQGEASEVARTVAGHAQNLWARMTDANDAVPLGHDGYLKLFSLRRPRIPTDYIMLDEAQDSSPCVIHLLKGQDATQVCVGDPAQQIYAWRGATDAMDEIASAHTAHLSQSFRFGPQLAAYANIALALLHQDVPIVGNPKIHTTIGNCEPRAVLTRSNAGLINEIVNALEVCKVPHVVKGTAELARLLEGVRNLKMGIPSDCPELFGYKDWTEVEIAVQDESEPDLKILVEIVDAHGEIKLLEMLTKVVEQEDRADIVLSTCHKAKGREWSTVAIAEDFAPPEKATEHGIVVDPDELRLLYVALTRAKTALQVPGQIEAFLKNYKEDSLAWWSAPAESREAASRWRGPD